MGRGDSAVAGFLRGAREHVWEVVPLHYMFPGLLGKVHEESHQWAKETFVNTLRKSGPIDGVFLQLHGTAVADQIEDCEGDLLRPSAAWSATDARLSRHWTGTPTSRR